MRKTDQPARFAPRSSRLSRLAAGPDAAGIATRLAIRRLRQARVSVEPLLRSAGLSGAQVNNPDTRISVASQIAFLELAAKALNDAFLASDLRKTSTCGKSGSFTMCCPRPIRSAMLSNEPSASAQSRMQASC